ncbi:LLM class flavin-dependent oxidoreductase [Agromyces atrinae]|uniref:LLM class flavin-dependent oxidoreductase n=1 Tax=Agromyces atrinae TaxID=592376 RepID=UPI001F594832|nr:LLM class flavin-dependent oxidoreductase [Agromyces atrinae]MCI2957541.1 LLM class flavin-dependent oxidoreductase [Agromyces atrinae]
MTRRPLATGVELDGAGAHPAAGRSGSGSARAALELGRYRAHAHLADDAGFTFASFTDRRPIDAVAPTGRIDPVTLATHLAATTSRLGLVVGAETHGAEPFHLANQLASLDWARRGGAGLVAHAPRDHRAEGDAVVDAIRALWDTWEDGIFIADEPRAAFLDADKWHYAEVETEFFSIAGPSITPRPPSGRLPVFGRLDEFDAASLDVVIVGGGPLADLATIVASARSNGAERVLLHLEVAVGDDAADRIAELDARHVWAPNPTASRFIGTATELVTWVHDAAAPLVDGILFDPAVIDLDLPALTESVVKRLDAAEPLDGPERLRRAFGLPSAPNRFTERRSTTTGSSR